MRWWLWAFLASMCFFAGAESVVCEDPETAGEGATEARTVNENCRASALNAGRAGNTQQAVNNVLNVASDDGNKVRDQLPPGKSLSTQ